MSAAVDTGRALPWFATLMYHRVVERVVAPDPHHLQIGQADFDRQLGALAARGCRVLDPAAALAAARAGEGADVVVLTFDDGYADFHAHALPVLGKYGFVATVFVVSERIGGWNDWDAGVAPRADLMDITQLREVLAAGIRIGSHSATHPRLARLAAADLRREIAGSRRTLEDRLGVAVDAFCYPYGDCSAPARDAVVEAGYTAAFGSDPKVHECFRLSRIDGARATGRWSFRWRTGGHARRWVG
jgi:peptidoglycan/xylan/chitin deacetylase (PgdA/CDA1 family)